MATSRIFESFISIKMLESCWNIYNCIPIVSCRILRIIEPLRNFYIYTSNRIYEFLKSSKINQHIHTYIFSGYLPDHFHESIHRNFFSERSLCARIYLIYLDTTELFRLHEEISWDRNSNKTIFSFIIMCQYDRISEIWGAIASPASTKDQDIQIPRIFFTI